MSPTGQLTNFQQLGLIPDLIFSSLQMESLGVAPTVQPTQGAMPTFTSAFQRRAGGVLATSYLQRFLETAHCALKHLVQP